MKFGLKRLAITGGPGEGKSTVLGYVRDQGLPTLSADELARQVWVSDDVQSAVAALLDIEGPVAPDRARQALLERPSFRRQLNRLMHPIILDEILSHPAQIVEVPLLLETCLQPLFQRIWVVSCGPDEQLRRLTERLGRREAALKMLGAQLDSNVKCTFADRIVRTNREEPSVRAYVLKALSRDFG